MPFTNACDIFVDKNLVSKLWDKNKIKLIQNYINETREHKEHLLKKLALCD